METEALLTDQNVSLTGSTKELLYDSTDEQEGSKIIKYCHKVILRF